MEKLSPEILDEILAYVFEDVSSQGKLSRYATVSLQWQKAVELKTLRSISIKCREIDEFSSLFSASRFAHRRHALRCIFLEMQMPANGQTLQKCRENNIYFRNVIVKLFNELSSWEDDMNENEKEARRNTSLRLTLSWSPGDGKWSCSSFEDVWLNFPDDDGQPELPTLSFVTCLRTETARSLTPHPAALCRIVSRMPFLRKLRLRLWTPTHQNIALRLEHHRALAKGVESFVRQNPHLSKLEIWGARAMHNHSLDEPDFREDGVDRLSAAIRRMGEAGKLTELYLWFVPVSSELFCERRNSSSSQAEGTEVNSSRTWPSIQVIWIRSELATADGQWLYTGDPNVLSIKFHEDSDDVGYITDGSSTSANTEDDSSMAGEVIEHIWRMAPDPAVFDPFIESMARTATRKMPSLRRFSFHTWMPPGATHLVDGANHTVAFRMAEAGEPFDSNYIPHFPALEDWQHERRFDLWFRPEWNVPESVMAMGREWVGELGTASITEPESLPIIG